MGSSADDGIQKTGENEENKPETTADNKPETSRPETTEDEKIDPVDLKLDIPGSKMSAAKLR